MNDDLFILLKASLDTDVSTATIVKQLKTLESNLKEINISLKLGNIDEQMKNMFEKMTSGARKAKEETEKVFKEMSYIKKGSTQFNDMIDTKSFNEIEKHVAKIKASVRELDSVKIRVGIDDEIQSAVLKYTDNMGIAITETMRYTTLTDDDGNKTKIWETHNIAMDENIKKARDLSLAIERFKSDMGSKLDVMDGKKIVDESEMQRMRSALQGLSVDTADVGNVMKDLKVEYGNINRESATRVTTVQKEKQVMSEYEAQIREATTAKKLQTLALDDYVKKMESMVFDKSSENGFSEKFNGLDDSTKLLAVNNLTQAYKQQESALKETANIKSKIENATKKESEAYSKLTFDLKEFQKLQGNKLSLLGDTNADAKKLADLQARIKGLTADTPNLRNEMKKIINDISVLGSQSEKTGSSFGLLTKYFSAYQVFALAKRAISSLISEVYELDKALIELKKTTSMSDTELTSFSKYAYKEASELGRSGIDFTNAVADFRRGGYDLTDATTMARNALLTLNIGDGITSVEQSSKGLISVTKALKMSADDSIQVLDKVNNVANNTSISFDALYEILTKSTGVLAQTGSDLDQIIAMSNAGFATLRDASAISTGLNSISTRLMAVKQGAKEVDGEIVSKLEPTLMRIAKVKVMDENGLRSMYDVLDDLAKVYPTLNKEQQQLIATEIGGRQQIKTITALLQNWGEAEKALAFSMNSTGSAMEEQSNFIQGLEYKLSNMKTAWSSLAQTTINSDFIKGLVDGTTALIQFVDAMGGLTPIIVGAGVALWLLSPAISSIVAGIWASVPALASASGASLGLALSFGWITGIVVMVTALTSGLIYMSNSAERAEARVQGLKDELAGLKEEVSQSDLDIGKFEGLSAQYEDLKRIKEAQGLTNEQQEEFIRIQNEIKQVAQQVNGYLDSQGNFIISETANLKEVNRELREYNQNKREETAKKALESSGETVKQYEKEASNLEVLIERYNLYQKGLEGVLTEADKLRQVELEEMYPNLFEDVQGMDELGDKVRKLGEEHNNTANSINNELINIMAGTKEWGKLTEEQENAIRRLMSELDPSSIKAISKSFKDGSQDVELYVNRLLSVPKVLGYIEDAANGIGGSAGGVDNLEASLVSLGIAQEKVSDAFKDTTKDIEVLDNTMAKLTAGKVLSKTEALNLVDAYGLSMDSIQEVTGGYKIEEGALESLRKVKIDSIKASIQAEQNMSDAVRDATNARLKSFGVEIQGLEDLAKARGAIFSAQISIGNQAKSTVTGKYGSSGDSGITAGLINTEYERLLGEQGLTKESINMAKTSVDEYEKSLNQVSESKKRLALLEAKSGQLWSAPSGGSNDSKSKGSSSKADLPKYITQGFDDISAEILTKSDKLEREIAQANAKILNAQLLGNTEEELALQTQLEGMYDQRMELEKEKSVAFLNLRKKVSDELAKQNFGELKGINIEQITEKQLADVNRKIDAEIDKANKSKNDKLANTLKIRQDMINEYSKAIIDANTNVNSISLNLRELENEAIEKTIALIKRKYELEDRTVNNRIRDIEIQMLLTKDGSAEQLALEKKMYDEKLNIQNNYLKRIKELREQNLEMESKEIDEWVDKWHDAERERLNMLKSMGEQAKKLKLDSLNTQQTDLNEAQKATQTLVDMVIKMLKQQYDEEKKLIQENSKAKEDAIKKEIDGYKKVIDAKKKSLREEKDNKDYDKELKVKQKKVSDIENKILVIANDNSKKAQAERLRLEQEKLGLIDELNEYQENRSIELQEKALDEELTRYEDAKNEELNQYKTQKDKELKILDDYLAKEGNLRAEAIRLIERKNSDLYNQLMDWNREYSTGVDEDVSDAWNNAYKAMETYGNGQNNVLSTLGNIVQKLKEVKANMDDINNSSWQDYVDQEDISPDKSKFPVYETEPDKPSSSSSNSSNNSKKEEKPKLTVQQAKEELQASQQRYFHNEALKAKETGNSGLLKWVQSERKLWGIDPIGGGIERKGGIPPSVWEKEKKKYGYLKGGETDRTGFHWLDGSQKLPERILSPEQTQNFNKMVEYLPNVISKIEQFDKVDNNTTNGEVVFNIENMVNVEGNLDKDFDLGKMKDEIMKAINNVLANKGIKPQGVRLASGRV